MLADLHIHSYYSDGIQSPQEIVQMCGRNNYKYISITDHDNVDGAKEVSMSVSPTVIPGVELSCKSDGLAIVESGNAGVHILGYGIDIFSDRLNQKLKQREQKRMGYLDAFLNHLRAKGIEVESGEITAKYGRMIQASDVIVAVNRKHFVDAKQQEEIYVECIRCLDKANFTPEEAVELIRELGGVAVWAHPYITYSDGKKVFLKREEIELALHVLVELGLQGIETEYLAFTEEQRDYLRNLARTHRLYVSAGSDFHGYTGRDEFYTQIPQEVMPLLKHLQK